MQLNIVLYKPEIPQNTGAIGRLCVGLQAKLHLIKPLGFNLDEKKLRRAGMDYWQHVDLAIHNDWQDFINQENPKHIFLTTANTNTAYFDITYPKNSYIIFGSESVGLPKDLQNQLSDKLITIPMPGHFGRSHNIANAASVIAYEIYRQSVKIDF